MLKAAQTKKDIRYSTEKRLRIKIHLLLGKNQDQKITVRYLLSAGGKKIT